MKYFILVRDIKEICKLSYYDTRLGIVNNWAFSSTPGWNAVDDYALNSVFSGLFNQLGSAPQTGDSTALSTNSNPFSFERLASSSWSMPQMNWSFPQSGGGGDWLSNALGSLSSLGSWSVQGGSNSGPVNVPSYASQNNRNKIAQLDTDMQKAVIELMNRANARGIHFEIKEGFCSDKERKERKANAKDPRWYANGVSRHSVGMAVDIDRKSISSENLQIIGHIWRDEMGFTWGQDFKSTPEPEPWHCDLRPNIRGGKNAAANTWLAKGGQSSYASGGYSSGSDWLSSLSSTMSFPTLSMGSWGGGFGGGSWINSMFGGSMRLGGWRGSISSTRALPSQYQDKIQKYCNMYGGDAKLVSCMIHRESTNNANAVSSAGAEGLMQLMPGTARELGVTNSKDPDQNISGGVRYINKLIKKYNGDVRTGLAAYNAGPVEINNLVKRYGTTDYNVIGPHVNGDTQGYVRDIMNRYNSSGGYLTV